MWLGRDGSPAAAASAQRRLHFKRQPDPPRDGGDNDANNMQAHLRRHETSSRRCLTAASPCLRYNQTCPDGVSTPPPLVQLLLLSACLILLRVTRCISELNWPLNPPFHLSSGIKDASSSAVAALFLSHSSSPTLPLPLFLSPDRLRDPDILQAISA